uniref:Uncharacterized protein n=1 Tax=Rhizophora mucronata TaxID=61149 RepID=A0A2P2NCA8_RHIMU
MTEPSCFRCSAHFNSQECRLSCLSWKMNTRDDQAQNARVR